MNERERIKRNLLYNEKWVERDPVEIKRIQKKNARRFTKSFNGKSPQLELENNELQWKRPSKHGTIENQDL